ncbi:MAG: hypothetical protein GY847_28580 [Proteobacteria bacterium]|nr:hypothetical protein [Pseudomonadota bacterium]
MKRLVTFQVFTGLILLSLTALAVVNVPNPHSEKAVFSGDKLTAMEDGSRVIVGEVAMITGTKDSQISEIEESNPAATRVKLASGEFLVHVGSKPIVIVLGDTKIEARSAELLLISFKGGWIIDVSVLFRGGSIKIQEGALNPSPGAPIQLTSSQDPKPASASAKTHLKKMTGLTEQSSPTSLRLQDIEDPSDLIAAKGSENDEADLEIDVIEIEVESDCVEVCVD